MDKKIISDEIELKKMLDSKGYRYGEIGCTDKFIICFRDNKSTAVISQGIYDSPIAALRDLNVIVPQTKLPIDEIDVQIVLAFNYEDTNKKPAQLVDYTVLDPYLYFKKKEIKNNEVTEVTEGE